MALGTNGSFAYKRLLERAAYTCADCGLHDDICVCEDGPGRLYYMVEQRDSDRGVQMLGAAIFGAICFVVGFLLAALAV